RSGSEGMGGEDAADAGRSYEDGEGHERQGRRRRGPRQEEHDAEEEDRTVTQVPGVLCENLTRSARADTGRPAAPMLRNSIARYALRSANRGSINAGWICKWPADGVRPGADAGAVAGGMNRDAIGGSAYTAWLGVTWLRHVPGRRDRTSLRADAREAVPAAPLARDLSVIRIARFVSAAAR